MWRVLGEATPFLPLADPLLMKIYTRGGDEGATGLFGGSRVGKNNARIEAFGEVDELNAAVGLARAQLAATLSDSQELTQLLSSVQHHLFDLGAELATLEPEEKGTALLQQAAIDMLEGAIDRLEKDLPALRNFILPGGDLAASHLHLARCVCRRAERRVVALAHVEPIRSLPVAYINRLGDLLFVAARWVNQASGQGDVPWQKSS
ncbi:Cob(I)yrinic acid a,c-diamide adenosyltransferase [Posidoniimonas polymericola]|uniref:Corrinoid adenosyltransferase n=2 Tax=Posidoniimonas polymericola TaxID=2528002 RepID=A0A5C5YS27_9BACT|nr:Cob(I)yrinic acid a,c-diamide adenosyltransferase [Posidoniimonas polymericola]